MTTIPFLPNNASAPPFQANVVLDGASYSLVTMWNSYRAGAGSDPGDWYMSLTDQNGMVIVNQPLIGSPPDSDIPLAPGLFTTNTLVFRASTQNFEIGP